MTTSFDQMPRKAVPLVPDYNCTTVPQASLLERNRLPVKRGGTDPDACLL